MRRQLVDRDRLIAAYKKLYLVNKVRDVRGGFLKPYGGCQARHEAIRDLVIEHLPDRNTRVLDASCGRGHLLRMLLAEGYQAEGTEVAPALLVPGADLDGLPVRLVAYHELRQLPEKAYDLVISSDVLEHLRDEADVVEGFESLMFLSRRLLIVSVGTGPAHKYPSGFEEVGRIVDDLHQVRQSAKWWRIRFERRARLLWERVGERGGYLCVLEKL